MCCRPPLSLELQRKTNFKFHCNLLSISRCSSQSSLIASCTSQITERLDHPEKVIHRCFRDCTVTTFWNQLMSLFAYHVIYPKVTFTRGAGIPSVLYFLRKKKGIIYVPDKRNSNGLKCTRNGATNTFSILHSAFQIRIPSEIYWKFSRLCQQMVWFSFVRHFHIISVMNDKTDRFVEV